MGQSTLSTHLAQLKSTGIVEDRRTGKNIMYRLRLGEAGGGRPLSRLLEVLHAAGKQMPEVAEDLETMKLVHSKRQDRVRAYFDRLAGRFERHYAPGRSWKGLAETLLMLVPPVIVADLGAGEGLFAQMLARRAKEVIAIDNSERMVEFGARQARENRLSNLSYRKGDLEAVPIDDSTVDVALFSQSLHHATHPERAIAEAFRILKPGGSLIILDLARHNFEEARELYADLWLGFTEVELRRFMGKAGFQNVRTAIVHRESRAPHFETLLAFGERGLE